MKNKIKLAAAIALIAVAAGALYYFRVYRTQSLSKSDFSYLNKNQPKIEDPGLRTSRSTKEAREHLLDTVLAVSKRTRDIGPSCTSAFWSSFSFPAGQTAADGIPMADSGQVFQYSDAWQPGAPPLRRLIFAGELATGCFIYYQRGGLMFPRSCLAVMDYKKGRAVWVGETGREAYDLPELRKLLITGPFYDPGGLAC